jgi:hypothetical protein
MYLPEPSL